MLRISFTKDGCVFQDHITKACVATGHRLAGLYRFIGDAAVDTSKSLWDAAEDKGVSSGNKGCYASSKQLDIHLFHARLGHCSISKLKHIKDYRHYCPNSLYCDTCILSKFHRLPFPRSESTASNPFDLVHMDLWGPYRIADVSGAHYFLTVLDDCTRTTWTFLMQNKMQVLPQVRYFIAYVHTQFGKNVKAIRSDNGTKFIQSQCSHLFGEKGIIHNRSAPRAPQQNGRVERKHRHLV